MYELFEHFEHVHKSMGQIIYYVCVEKNKFFLILTDIDYRWPSIFEENIQMFTEDGKECDLENPQGSDKYESVAYYMCKKCKIFKFTNYHHYKDHVRTMHLFYSYNLYTCDRCYATFTLEKDYLIHEREAKHLSEYLFIIAKL
jgi:hypothetical protein